MGRKAKIPFIEKCISVEAYLRNEISLMDIAKLYDIHRTSVYKWISNYQSLGIDGLRTTSRNANYSENIKSQAVLDYLAGKGSQQDVCKKYGIRSKKQLQDWILKYNSHEKLKASGTGGVPIMTKGRKTDYNEKIEIVKYCIEHKNNYAETAQKYQVSYQQVYTWATKYERDGVEALQDRRGKRKTEDEMSELEKLKAQNKLLQAENRRKQMEIEFLKKLDEIERRRY